MKTIELHTERLLLRPFRLGDEKEVLEFSSNPIINRYTGDPIVTTLEGVKNTIENVWLRDYAEYGYGRLAVVHKKDNRIIGFCGIKYLPELKGIDLGYRFLPEYWGQGIATETSQVVLADAFNRLQLEKIYGFVEPENKASTNVLKKLKFQFEKEAPYPNETKPVYWYSITKSTYERQ